MKIIGLYAGKKRSFGPRGEFSAIRKEAIPQGRVEMEGLVDDTQVDRRFHGGPEKALHQFSLSAYERIAKRYPLFHKNAWPGRIGENLTIEQMADDEVCIGDIYSMGEVTVQISSPRIPCWKMTQVMGMPELEQFVAQKGISGWYYRVLEPGVLHVNDKVALLERLNPELSVSRFLQIHYDKQASHKLLQQTAEAKGLDPEWQQRLLRRSESESK